MKEGRKTIDRHISRYLPDLGSRAAQMGRFKSSKKQLSLLRFLALAKPSFRVLIHPYSFCYSILLRTQCILFWLRQRLPKNADLQRRNTRQSLFSICSIACRRGIAFRPDVKKCAHLCRF